MYPPRNMNNEESKLWAAVLVAQRELKIATCKILEIEARKRKTQ